MTYDFFMADNANDNDVVIHSRITEIDISDENATNFGDAKTSFGEEVSSGQTFVAGNSGADGDGDVREIDLSE